jgi:LacI family transcriptional regulator
MTIYDLAKKAGVSASTVSRVVNNKGTVKPETRERVLQILKEANFSVNEVARSLAIRSTNTIAMLATDIRENYYVQIAYMIERGLASKGVYSLFCSMGRDSKRQVDYIRAMVSKRVSAIVFIGSPARDTGLIATLLDVSKDVPVIITNGNLPGENIYCIQRDDAAGMRLSIDHLVAQGCKKLGFVSDFCYSSDKIKQSVFQDYLSHYNQSGITGEVLTCGQGLESSLAFAEELCVRDVPYEGFVCTNDVIAAGLVKGFSDHGIRIPHDRKVTGCDNASIAKLTTPTLTSIDYEIEKQGKIAVSILSQLCDNQSPEQNYYLITPTIKVRQSSQCAQ